MRPDSIPVTPLASHATLTPEAARALFGSEKLSGSERAEVIRHGEPLASVPVQVGAETRLDLDMLTLGTDARGLRLAGPLRTVACERVESVRSRLVAPSALARAWGLGGAGTLVLGPLALSLPVEGGKALGLFVEQALWLGAGKPDTARWAAGLDLGIAPSPTKEASGARGALSIPRRVVTETDVRQAILKRQTLSIRPDQIVTPAAKSLAREHNVFAYIAD